jgi:allantoicase
MTHMDDDQIMLFGDDDIAPLTLYETQYPLPFTEHNAAIDLAMSHIRATVIKNGTDEQMGLMRALIEALAAELGGLKK